MSAEGKTWYRRPAIWVIAVLVLVALMIIVTLASLAKDRKEAATKQAIADTCADEVFSWAKYPAGAEFTVPVAGVLQDAEEQQGPAGTEYVSVNLGDVNFVNGFGVPSEFAYGCVTYHDSDLEILDSTALAKEKTNGMGLVVYLPHSDELK